MKISIYTLFSYFISIIYTIQLDLTLFFLFFSKTEKGYVFAEKMPLTMVVNKRVNQFV